MASVAGRSLSPANKSQLCISSSKSALIPAAFSFDLLDVGGPSSGRRGGFYFILFIFFFEDSCEDLVEIKIKMFPFSTCNVVF